MTSTPTAILGTQFFEQFAARLGGERIHPAIAAAFQGYLQGEKLVPHGEQWVINTHLPPYPSHAFELMVGRMLQESGESLFSVTLAVTNRCPMNCWHCYNADRSLADLPLELWQQLASELQNRGASVITLTGGEPLLRRDLELICEAFDGRSAVNVGTTGLGLTAQRAASLAAAGVFSMGFSLDAVFAAKHDELRGRVGAHAAALRAIELAGAAGMYPYVVAVGTREFLEEDNFHPYMDYVQSIGAREVHLLEPCASGRLKSQREVLLNASYRQKILDYQHEYAARLDAPILSTFTYLEGEQAFGCGAGLTHLYIDGAGEVSPCNLVPLSFGNVGSVELEVILQRMRAHFKQPRAHCLGRELTPKIPDDAALPLAWEASDALCAKCLPKEHKMPRFFSARVEAAQAADELDEQLRDSYNAIHADYDEFWAFKAAQPALDLLKQLELRGDERVFEAGGGTGVATEAIAAALNQGGQLTSVDLSQGMQELAKKRVKAGNIAWHCGDALAALQAQAENSLDVVYSSWVLGYIELAPFFAAAKRALKPGGKLAFIVHLQNSPKREMELFVRLVARDPSVLTHAVGFDFPRSLEHLEQALSGFSEVSSWQSAVDFPYNTPEEVLEHLLKSGAGTVFYESIRADLRPALTQEFLNALAAPLAEAPCVSHDYVAAIARA